MHTGSGPLIVTVGAGLTVTVLVHAGLAPGQPSRVTLRLSVNVPAPSAFTVTDALVVDPTIEPFPLIAHAYVTAPPLGLTVAL